MRLRACAYGVTGHVLELVDLIGKYILCMDVQFLDLFAIVSLQINMENHLSRFC